MEYLSTSQMPHIVWIVFDSAVVKCMDQLVSENSVHCFLGVDCVLA